MQKYTLGFIFNSSLDKVLLIHKLKPSWQMGKINGVGGKIEVGEETLACMLRETQEECGLQTDSDKWIYLGDMHSKEWNIEVFGYIHNGNLDDAMSMESEQVEWFKIKDLPKNMLTNLNWLIAFALDKIGNQYIETFSVKYRN